MKICSLCVLPEAYPGIEFDEDGVCNFCHTYKTKKEEAAADHFENEQELIACLEKYRNSNNNYDVLIPLSGGVDSCNVLVTIVEKYGLKPLGFHNDQGYEDEVATNNVRNLCETMGVDLVIARQDMEFMKKLYKYINESKVKGLNSCYVCGNILYINALEMADRYHIPLVINGYSKGQAVQISDIGKGVEALEALLDVIKETGDKEFFNKFIDKYKILDKRIGYRTRKDLEKDVDYEKILFVPFYVFNFYKIDKALLRKQMEARFDWKPQSISYPGRTTNCKMIWLNTYMDLKKMGYSCYHLEYAELVRRGEFTREQALRDLEFTPPPGLIEQLAQEIGIDFNRFDAMDKQVEKESPARGAGVEIEFGF